MKTSYAETGGYAKLDWRERLEAVAIDEAEEIMDLRCFAGRWPTCACGQSDVRIVRERDGCPLDGPLSRLGVEFEGHLVRMQDFALRHSPTFDCKAGFNSERAGALRVLEAIEKRESELIDTVLATQHKRLMDYIASKQHFSVY